MTNILDLPETTINSGSQIKKKRFLNLLYKDFYLQMRHLSRRLPKGRKVELGSGGGFLKEVIPDLTTSDVLKLPTCDMVINAERLPFTDKSLCAIYMLNTFHHIKNPINALKEFDRCLKKKGKVIMVEPYGSIWGKFIYKNFHYEGFDEKAGWRIKGSGPLSDANNALPWIIFERDIQKFNRQFPSLKITYYKTHSPFRYLLSGGLFKPQILPSFLFPAITKFEDLLTPLMKQLGMFVTIVLEKR